MSARLLLAFEKVPTGKYVMRRLAHWPITATVLDAILGYYRVFNSLAEATAAVCHDAEGGHENPSLISLHMSRTVRPSDYAALLHLREMSLEGMRVFDLGGNVGHLFYLYDQYLHFPPNFTWQVFDLPLIVTQGKSIAAACGEARLQFTSQWQDASGADLLLASGALHYFDVPFDKMIAEFAPKPSYILINRTPLIDGPTKATVQLSTGPKTPCVLYNSAQLISGVEAIGYELVDSWKAPERSLKIVGKPEYSADAYSGLFFRVKRLA